MNERGGGLSVAAWLGSWAVLLAVLPIAAAETPDAIALRREYNRVTAVIDTLARSYTTEDFERLSRLHHNAGVLPASFDLVLLFWADDEAELFLNGFRVGQTRLTPTLIELPEVYLRPHNVLEARCWDTDRVESGFMAGLYLRDRAGGLRRVLVTGDSDWRAGEEPAETIYYNHAQPDIPGARVIWAAQLFGTVRLSVEFGAAALTRAQRRPAVQSNAGFEQRGMDTQDLVARLVTLDTRKRELARSLANLSGGSELSVSYAGYAGSPLAFTLGKAARLQERDSMEGITAMQRWLERLPSEDKQLILQRGRELKGSSAATAAARLAGMGDGGESEREDRRTDYRPPRDRGGLVVGRGSGSALVGGTVPARSPRVPWGAALVAVAMATYLGVAGRSWWRLFSRREWRP